LAGGNSRLARAVGEAFEALREGGSSDPNSSKSNNGNGGGNVSTSAGGAAAVPPSFSFSASFEELEGASDEQLLEWLADEGAFAALARGVAARVKSRVEAAEAEEAAATAAGTTTTTTATKRNSKKTSSSPAPPPFQLQSPEAAATALTARLASSSLAREQELRELLNQAAVVRATELAPAAAEASRLRARARVVAAAISPQALVEALKGGAALADADSTRCCDAFLAAGGERGAAAAAAAAASSPSSSASAAAGQRALDSFLDEYVRLRSKFHERELKQQAAEQTLL